MKDETYYVERIEELRSQMKNISLIAKENDEYEGTYQIWSLRSDDDGMCHHTHDVLYAKHEEDEGVEMDSNA